MKTKPIRVSEELKKKLDKEKLVPTETYDHVIKRFIKVGK